MTMHIGKRKLDRKESWHIQSMGQTAYMSTVKYSTIVSESISCGTVRYFAKKEANFDAYAGTEPLYKEAEP